MFGARSGCRYWTPLSTTATTTFGLPVVRSHASTASMSASAVPATPLTAWAVLWRPQSFEKRGSFGIAWDRQTPFGSA